MPQIAQQDYIKIPIANLEEITEEEKAMLKKHIDNHTIWDALIVNSAGEYCRPIAVTPSGENIAVCVYSDEVGRILNIYTH